MFLAGIVFMLAGCSFVTVKNGEIDQSHILGSPIGIRQSGSKPLTIVQSRGFGWVPHLSGVTIGFHSESSIISWNPDACQVVLLPPEVLTTAYEQLVKLLKDSGTRLCEVSVHD